MEREILERLKMNSRAEVVAFLKNLWAEKPQPCPFCGGHLDFLHKKAKKSNCNWVCTDCGTRIDTLNILNELNEQQ